MKHFILLSLFALLSLSLNSHAQDSVEQSQWYQIELIVFEYTGSNSASEARSPDEPPPDTSQTQELIPQSALDEYLAFNASSGPGEQAYAILPNTALSLSTAAYKLNNKAKHRVLYHVAWRQPVSAPELAKGVHIHSNMNNDALYIAKLATQRAETPSESQPARLPLDGSVRVSVSRFLHLDVDLTFTREEALTPEEIQQIGDSNAVIEIRETPQTTQNSAAAIPTHTLRTYRLVEERRMKSKETHYFDHPAFGVVATITPYNPDN